MEQAHDAGGAPAAVAATPGTVPPPGAFKKELLLAKRREGELTSRLSAIEAEANTARATVTEYQDQVTDLSDRLQVCPGPTTTMLCIKQ